MERNGKPGNREKLFPWFSGPDRGGPIPRFPEPESAGSPRRTRAGGRPGRLRRARRNGGRVAREVVTSSPLRPPRRDVTVMSRFLGVAAPPPWGRPPGASGYVPWLLGGAGARERSPSAHVQAPTAGLQAGIGVGQGARTRRIGWRRDVVPGDGNK